MGKQGKKTDKAITSGRNAGEIASFSDMERWMEDFFRRSWASWAEFPAISGGRLPKVDVIERDSEIMLRAEVPGVDKEDLDITVRDNSVTIKGETRHEKKEEKGNYFHSEITHGSFSRTIPLPGTVDTEKVRTSFSNGVLELILPRAGKAQKRSIKID